MEIINLKVINYGSKVFSSLCAVIFIFANPNPDFLTDKDKIDAIRHVVEASVNICRISDECKKSKKKKDS
jgi:hypothetical protein